jgi:acyl-CoA oxidase
MFQNWVPSQTYEGENTILYLQTARFLLKSLQKSISGAELHGSVSYLSQKNLNSSEKVCKADSIEYFSSPTNLLKLYEHRSRRMLLSAAKLLQQKISSGMKASLAMESLSVDLVKCARAHAMFMLMHTFYEYIQKLSDTSPDLIMIKMVQLRLFSLIACYYIEAESGDFLFDGYLNGRQIQFVSLYERELLKQIRPDVISLVDAFDFSDHLLNSALGRFDGKVYKALYDWAQESPLNESEVPEAVKKYLLPIMQDDRPVQITSKI